MEDHIAIALFDLARAYDTPSRDSGSLAPEVEAICTIMGEPLRAIVRADILMPDPVILWSDTVETAARLRRANGHVMDTPEEGSFLASIAAGQRGNLALHAARPFTEAQRAALSAVEAIMRLGRRHQRADRMNQFALHAAASLNCLDRSETLAEQLRRFADVATQATRVSGAMIVALDEGHVPVAFGTCGLSWSRLGSAGPAVSARAPSPGSANGNADRERSPQSSVGPLTRLRDLVLLLQKERSFPCDVPPGWFSAYPGDTIRAYPIQGSTPPPGFQGPHWLGLLVAAVRAPVCKVSERALKSFTQLAATAIRDALQRRTVERFSRLRAVLQAANVKQLVVADIVRELQAIFEADVVTILLDDHGRLRLSATTDSELGREKPVVYEPGQGLTGFAFKERTALRFFNDEEAHRFRRERCGTEGPLFAERDHDHRPTTQILLVPMRHGAKVAGVIRMSRSRDAVHFTADDETALQFFADLLGALLADPWMHLLKSSIGASTHEAVVIARLEDGEGATRRPVVVRANPGAERLYGRGASTLIGMCAAELHPPEEHDKIRTAIRAARSEGNRETAPIETVIVLADGTRRPIEMSLHTLENPHLVPPSRYLLGVARDLSERNRREAELQRLESLLEHLGFAYFRSNAQGITERSSPLDRKITGYSEEDLRRTPRTVLYPNPSQRSKVIQQAPADGRITRRLIHLRRKSGEEFPVEADMRVILSDAGEFAGLEGVYREVADTLALQEYLDANTAHVLTAGELLEKLKADAEFQRTYLMSLAHQLKSPLIAFRETVRNTEEGVYSGRQTLVRRARHVIGQTNACIEQVNNLMHLDRVLHGRQVEHEPVILRRLLLHVAMDFAPLAEEGKIEWRVDQRSIDEHVRVLGDPTLLRQVFVNLFDNAVKYSYPETSIVIRGTAQGDRFAVKIVNEGIPILPEDRERIFERGTRLDGARAIVPAGSGIGLWLVRKILKLHDVHIECQSEPLSPGRGSTTFRMAFRRAR